MGSFPYGPPMQPPATPVAAPVPVVPPAVYKPPETPSGPQANPFGTSSYDSEPINRKESPDDAGARLLAGAYSVYEGTGVNYWTTPHPRERPSHGALAHPYKRPAAMMAVALGIVLTASYRSGIVQGISSAVGETLTGITTSIGNLMPSASVPRRNRGVVAPQALELERIDKNILHDANQIYRSASPDKDARAIASGLRQRDEMLLQQVAAQHPGQAAAAVNTLHRLDSNYVAYVRKHAPELVGRRENDVWIKARESALAVEHEEAALASSLGPRAGERAGPSKSQY